MEQLNELKRQLRSTGETFFGGGMVSSLFCMHIMFLFPLYIPWSLSFCLTTFPIYVFTISELLCYFTYIIWVNSGTTNLGYALSTSSKTYQLKTSFSKELFLE